jgi:hypothetical protein
MNRRTVIVVALGVVALLLAGGLYASNMGFKLNRTLLGLSNPTPSAINTLGLPYFRQSGIDDAFQLLGDIEAGDTTRVTNIQRWNPTTDTLTVYAGAVTDPVGFPLEAGAGYFVVLGNSSLNYIVVGSHDPGLSLTLKGTGSTPSGINFFSYPYHSTAADALQLIADIEDGDTTKVTNVQRWNPTSDTLTVYSGAVTDPVAFSLTPGDAYFIVMGGSDQPYVASHY